MIVAASLRALVRRRGRTLLALAGITVSAALLLDMTMLASGLTTSFLELLRASGYALRVTPRGILPFDSEASITGADGVRRRIEAVPGVETVAPVLGAQFRLVEDGETAPEPLFTVGVDPDAQFLYRLTEGRGAGPGEVVVSGPLAAGAGLAPGDTVRIAGETAVTLGRARETETFVVVGVGDFLYDYAGQRSLAMSLGDVRRLTARRDEVSLFGVAVAEGADEEAVARRIGDAVPEVSALSTGELTEEMDRRLLYFRQLASILGGVAMVVTVLLVSTIVTIGVRERFGEIATLRAIGVRRGRILLGVVAEGLALAAAGCLLGLPLGLWMAGRLDRILLAFPGLPADVTFFAWEPERIALALGAVVLLGAAAGCLPGLAAVRAPLSRALREEAE